MATKLFLRSTSAGVSTYKLSERGAGAGSTTVSQNTVASGTEVLYSSGEWVSPELLSGFTLSGTVTVSVWNRESNMSANIGIRAKVFKRTAAGVESAVCEMQNGGEVSTTSTEYVMTATPGSGVAFAAGDRIGVRFYMYNAGTMGAGYQGVITFNGPDATAGDSFIEITEDVALTGDPTGTWRINCGSASGYTDTLGNTWLADQNYSAGEFALTGNPIANTVEDTLYQSERWNSAAFTYTFDIPNGDYQVTLKWSENSLTSAGQRQMHVDIEGTRVLTNFDIFAAAGAGYTAVDRVFNVTVSDGQLNITFSPGAIEYPTIAAIEVVPATGTTHPLVGSSVGAGTLSAALQGVNTLQGSAVGESSLTGQLAEPSEIPAADVWYRADDATLDGLDGVSQWTDKSGNGRHATQATDWRRPTRVAGVLNGQPVLRFDGINDVLESSLAIGGDTALTIVLVAANSNAAVDGGDGGFWNNVIWWDDPNDVEYATHVGSFQGNVTWRFGDGLVGQTYGNYTRPVNIGGAFSSTVAHKDGATETLYVDGAQVQQLTGRSTTLGVTTSTITIGQSGPITVPGLLSYFTGDIAEIIVYRRALTGTELTALNTYLAARYGLGGQAGQTHVLAGQAVAGSSAVAALRLRSALTGQATAASSTVAALSLRKTLQGSVACVSSAVAALRLSGALAGQATAASALESNLRLRSALQGAVVGVSSALAALRARQALKGAAEGASSAAGALPVRRSVAGSAVGTSSAAGSSSVVSRLVGSAVGGSTSSGLASVVRRLSGAVVGAAELVGVFNILGAIIHALAGSSAGSSAASAALRVRSKLLGSAQGASEATGAARGVSTLSGSAAGAGSGAGALRGRLALLGSAVGAGSSSAALRLTRRLIGVAQGTSSLVGEFATTGVHVLAGIAQGVSSAQATLVRVCKLTGSSQGQPSEAVGPLRKVSALRGSSVGVGSGQAPLSRVRRLVSAAVGTSTGAAVLGVTMRITASVLGEGSLYAALSRVQQIAGSAEGAASSSGSAQIVSPLSGGSGGSSVLESTGVSVWRGLRGVVQGVGQLIGALIHYPLLSARTPVSRTMQVLREDRVSLIVAETRALPVVREPRVMEVQDDRRVF